MDVRYQDLPDDGWRRAAEIAFNVRRSAMTPPLPALVILRPWRSPDGAIVPCMLRTEIYDAGDTVPRGSTILVWNDKVANMGGPAAATGLLATAGFPAHRMSLGHLLDVLYLTDSIEKTWFQAPCNAGWDRFNEPNRAVGTVSELEYTGNRAVLHLYRAIGSGASAPRPAGGPPGMPGGGGGYTMPLPERLDVTFDGKATFTTALLRRRPGTTEWAPAS